MPRRVFAGVITAGILGLATYLFHHYPVDRTNPTITIDAPQNEDTIRLPYDMRGTFEGKIKEADSLWVLARDQYNNFFLNSPTLVISQNHQWSHTIISLGSPGRWELHVCLANEGATRQFQKRVDRNDWSGFPTLPEGAQTLRCVVVQVQKR